MAAGELQGAVIATHPEDDLCAQTMRIFVTAYGSEAGVAALKWLPYGGQCAAPLLVGATHAD